MGTNVWLCTSNLPMRTRNNAVSLVVVSAIGLVLAGCGDETVSTGGGGSPTTTITSAQGPPSRDPDLVGRIISLAPAVPGRDIEGTILVEASRGAPVGGLGDKASLTIRRNQTAIWVCGPGDESAAGSFEDLATGGSVSVWVDGPVAESYPVQATASALAAGSCG
jgi:Protein of unknown function (DUF3221)